MSDQEAINNTEEQQAEEQKPEIRDGVIYHPDGTRLTEKKNLRLIRLPKINFKETVFKGNRISDELEMEIKQIFDQFAEEDHAKPEAIVEGLKSVDYHLQNPEVFRIIEDFSHAQGKDKQVTFPTFMNYLNDRLAEVNSWSACGKVFANIIDKDLLESEQKSEITEFSLHKVLENLGEKLTIEDIKYMLDFVSDGKDPNIVQDEFYYLMTKRPIEYDALANITKSFKS